MQCNRSFNVYYHNHEGKLSIYRAEAASYNEAIDAVADAIWEDNKGAILAVEIKDAA